MASKKTDKRPKKSCSLLCYIAADNDLSSYALKDVEEMSARGCPRSGHIGVEMDTRGNKGSLRYEITRPDFTKRGHRTVIERIVEQDSGSFVTLRNFIHWGINRCNAKQRIAVIWGHGMGNAAAPDFQSMGGSISITELVTAFQQAGIRNKKEAGIPNWSGRTEDPVAILCFDACNMASIENIWGLRSVARMVVASQEKVPATGMPYGALVDAQKILIKNKSAKDATLKEAGKKIVDAYIESYQSQGISALTMSAVLTNNNLGKIVDLANQFGTSLKAGLRQKKSPLREACDEARYYGQSFHIGEFIDLGHFALLLSEDARLEGKAVAKAAKALHQGIVRSRAVTTRVGHWNNKPNLEVADATGLSIWYPAHRLQYLTKRHQYVRDNANSFNGWQDFLDQLYQ